MEVIEHYKKKLLRHIEEPEVVLYCLKKLDGVPITIEILQDSEVGKTVNRLKKRTDTTPEVIQASKALVEKWKELVKNADEADHAEQRQPPALIPEQTQAVTSSSKSKIPSEEKKSSSSKNHHHHHHKKEKKDKHHKEHKEHKEKHHKHHKSHKSKDKTSSSNGSSSIEIPSDVTPNYKPPKIRHFPQEESSHSRSNGSSSAPKMTDDDALTAMISFSKSQRHRTAVYSGRKTSAFSKDEKFPTLAELCVHVLQDNVTRIDECGNLPYELLKPILERGKPDDLMRIEEFNPRLMEDTGELWEKIVKRHFPRGEREEFESYREMYERLVQEREEKLDKLMGKVQNSYATLKTNNKHAKLAYVNTVAKPPRGVKRAQEKNGMSNSFDKVKKPRMTSKGDLGGASSSSNAAKKTKVAPIMAKTLKMARGLKTGFRR